MVFVAVMIVLNVPYLLIIWPIMFITALKPPSVTHMVFINYQLSTTSHHFIFSPTPLYSAVYMIVGLSDSVCWPIACLFVSFTISMWSNHNPSLTYYITILTIHQCMAWYPDKYTVHTTWQHTSCDLISGL